MSVSVSSLFVPAAAAPPVSGVVEDEVVADVRVPLRAARLTKLVVRSMRCFVLHVVRVRSVVEVRKAIVRVVSVPVARLESLWARSNEGDQDNLVDTNLAFFSVAAEPDPSVPVLVNVGTQYAASNGPTVGAVPGPLDDDSVEATHAPVIGDFVQVIESWYRAPEFAHANQCSRMSLGGLV